MGKIQDRSNSLNATSCSRNWKCLFCGQSLKTSLWKHGRADTLISKEKVNDSRRHNRTNNTSNDGSAPSLETLFGGIQVIQESLQVDCRFPEKEDRAAAALSNNVSAEEVCCNQCFTTLEDLIQIQEQIENLETSKWELVKLLHTLIIKYKPRQKMPFGTNPDCRDIFTEFRDKVSKVVLPDVTNLQRSLLKVERETTPPPTDNSIICEDIFSCVESCGNDHLTIPDVRESSDLSSRVQDDCQPFMKWERTVINDDNDRGSVEDFSAPESPQINYDDLESSESDASYHPEMTRRKQRASSRKKKRPPTVKVGSDGDDVVKRKRGRPKKLQPCRTENSAEQCPPKRGRGRPRVLKNSNDDEHGVPEKRKRVRPSRIAIVNEANNKASQVPPEMDPPQSAINDNPPADKDINPDNVVSVIKPRKHKANPVSPSQHRSPGKKHKNGAFPILNQDGSAFHPIYALNQVEGEYLFLYVKLQITPTSFLCQYPDCSHEIRFVGHFTEQTAFLMQRLHIRNQHRGGFTNRYVKSKADSSKGHYCCCHCQLQLDSRSELIQHHEEHHDDIPSPLAVCEVCGFLTPEEALIDHIITHKSAVEKETVKAMPPNRLKQISRPAIFPCDECSKVFDNLTILRLHRVTHVPVEQRKQHICDLCGDLFMSDHNLNQHKSAVHFKDKLDRPYECPYCEKKFLKMNKPVFENHVRTHTGEKPFQCEQCGKGFGSKGKFYLHKKTHVNESIPCQYCGQIYKSMRYLLTHHKKHHPELVDWSRLKRKESREKCFGPALMFPCEPCGHLYKFKSALVAHLKNKHKMRFQRKEEYPGMWTWEDDLKGEGK